MHSCHTDEHRTAYCYVEKDDVKQFVVSISTSLNHFVVSLYVFGFV